MLVPVPTISPMSASPGAAGAPASRLATVSLTTATPEQETPCFLSSSRRGAPTQLPSVSGT